jgi:cobalt-zinc-cadmium efflux system protein
MTRTRRLTVSLAVNALVVAVEGVGGLVAHSMGLLADAGHNLTDVGALALSLVAVRWALRPRNAARTFGNHRGTILAALANSAIVSAVTVLVVVESLHRLGHPGPVRATTMVAVAAVALVVNAVAARVLSDGSHDLNMRAAFLHMAGDALASLAVVAAALAIAGGAPRWLDPASALAVAAVIAVQSVVVLRESVSVLLESTPADLDLAAVSAAMTAVPGVGEVHDLHAWSLSSEVRALSAHLVLVGHPTLEEANTVGEAVKAAVGGPFSIAHATLELECERCVVGTTDPCTMEPPLPPDGAPVGTGHGTGAHPPLIGRTRPH